MSCAKRHASHEDRVGLEGNQIPATQLAFAAATHQGPSRNRELFTMFTMSVPSYSSVCSTLSCSSTSPFTSALLWSQRDHWSKVGFPRVRRVSTVRTAVSFKPAFCSLPESGHTYSTSPPHHFFGCDYTSLQSPLLPLLLSLT